MPGRMPSRLMEGLRKHMGRARPSYLDEETAVMIPENGSCEQVKKKNNWRYLNLGEWQPLLHTEKTLEGVHAVFPAGVYLKNALNSNRFHVELLLDAPGESLCIFLL